MAVAPDGADHHACPPAVPPVGMRPRGGPGVIVVGIDPHKKTHTAVAVTSLGEVLGELTIPARRTGFEKLLRWARAFEGGRTFAVEDGR
ncbi:MAG: IS110 family transposase, partial [Actinomycetota bacterium]